VQRKLTFAYWQDPIFWALIMAGPVVVAGITIVIPDHVVGSMEGWNTALLVILIYPVLEEIVFRGLIMDALTKHQVFVWRKAGVSLANLIAATLFALSHLWGQSVGWALAIFVPGLVFGFAKERWGSLKFPVFFHAYYNACFFASSAS